MPDFAVKTAFTAVDGVSPSFKRMTGAANRFGASASASMSRVGRASAAVGGMIRGMLPILGGAAVLKFANDSIEAWKIQETAVANVEAGLKSTNNAIGITSKQFQDMASASQSVGIFGDETILQNATAQFLTFGNIGATNFDRIQRAALDVTAKLKGINATGEDLRGTSIMMGKAMDDPIRGMGAMRRVGISFSAAEELAVKKMVAMNDTVGAQNLMLKAIERQYGGTNEALRKTTAGMELASKNDLGDTMELVGKQLMPIKQSFYEIAVQLLPFVNSGMQFLSDNMNIIKPILKTLLGLFLTWKIYTWSVVLAQRAMIAVGWLKYVFMMKDVIAGAVIRTNAWAVAQRVINFLLAANPIGIVITAIGLLAYAIYDLYTNWEKYSLQFNIKIQDFITGFRAAKMEVYELGNALGMITDKELTGAKLGYLESFIQGNKLKLEQIRQNKAPNEAGANLQAGNTNVNVYNSADVNSEVKTSGRGAKVNMTAVGQN